MRLKILLGLVLTLGVWPAQAQNALSIALGPMFHAADRVVWGHCREINIEPLAGYDNLPVTRVRVEVTETFKGPDQAQIIYQQYGRPGDRRFSHLPSCQPDEEVLIFLYPLSQAGLTSPVGVEQGLFRISSDNQGVKTLRNGRGNRGLFEGMEERFMNRFTRSEQAIMTEANQGSPLRLTLLTRILRSLGTEPRVTSGTDGQ